MLREHLPPGEALRAAKLEMLRAGGPSAHPAHWAAFVLWGG
jgi:CHAT domain-containing protein